MSALAELADLAKSDVDAAHVLLDALLEGVRRDDRVMMLCLGVPLDVRPPGHLGEAGRRTWRMQRAASIDYAAKQVGLYLGRADFARACHAVAIFGAWSLRGTSGGSPWAAARRADPDYQERLAHRRERRVRRNRREQGLVEDPSQYETDLEGEMVAEAHRAREDAYWADPARPR